MSLSGASALVCTRLTILLNSWNDMSGNHSIYTKPEGGGWQG
jgi:hypothetical protein